MTQNHPIEEKRKSRKIGINFNPKEYDLLKSKADKQNISFGKFVKNCAMENNIKVKHLNIQAADPSLIRELNYVGNNLNQITKRIHQMNLENEPFDRTVLLSIKDILRELNNNIKNAKSEVLK